VTRPIRIVLVEDNDVFRQTLELLFGLRPEIEVVASVASGDDAPEATRAVLAAAPQARVVCLTASLTRAEQAQLFAAGAVACLTKDEDLDEIVAAVHDAAGRTARA
jgi:DNA-binding NarL/FixJ family response regulator